MDFARPSILDTDYHQLPLTIYHLRWGWMDESSSGSNAKITWSDFVLVESLHAETFHDENISLKDAISQRFPSIG